MLYLPIDQGKSRNQGQLPCSPTLLILLFERMSAIPRAASFFSATQRTFWRLRGAMVFTVGLKQRLEEQEKNLTVPQANPLAWPNILNPSWPRSSRLAHRGPSAAPFPGNEGLLAREENSGPVRERVDPFLGLVPQVSTGHRGGWGDPKCSLKRKL